MSSTLFRSRPVSPWRLQIRQSKSRGSFKSRNQRYYGRRYKAIMNLDSPTVSVTQIIPPWPKPRSKWCEPEEPDPSPIPTPPPTPPPPPPPEGEEEAEEEEDQELDEEQLAALKEEELRRLRELEEQRRLAECPPLPPPFPPADTPLSEGEQEPMLRAPPSWSRSNIGARDQLGLAEFDSSSDIYIPTDEVETPRRVVLLQDAISNYRQKKATRKAAEMAAERAATLEKVVKPNYEEMPSNFVILPDTSAILRGSQAVAEKDAEKQLPFTSILAIITSFKYKIDTWTKSIVDFVVSSGKNLCNKLQKQHHIGPSYILPKITIGHEELRINCESIAHILGDKRELLINEQNESYKPDVDVMFDGTTFQLEETLNKYLLQYDRGIITTYSYSCAFFKRHGYYFLFDGSNCNALGVRIKKGSGKACFLRFPNLHLLVTRIMFNKGGKYDGKFDQQFVLTRVVVQIIPTGVRFKLDDKYDLDGGPENFKFKTTVYDSKKKDSKKEKSTEKYGYQNYGGVCRVVGSTALPGSKSCGHFVCVVAMLVATMRPIRLWDTVLVDICIEKGIELCKKVKDSSLCQKRVIKNLFVCGKFFDLNVRNIEVVNENKVKLLEQYVRAVLRRMRYVIVMFSNGHNIVICQTHGFFHLFDCFPPPIEVDPLANDAKELNTKLEKVTPKCASWTRYDDMDSVLSRLEQHGGRCAAPYFFTFEVTSIRRPTRQKLLAYKLFDTFKTRDNPNSRYLQPKTSNKVIDEKLAWVADEDDTVPWSPAFDKNPLGLPRRTPKTLWRDWNIEFQGDLCSLWGTIHLTDSRFPKEHHGMQYLACCMVALVLTQTCRLCGWTSSLLDGIVIAGDKYHETLLKKLRQQTDYEISCTSFDSLEGQYGFYSFTPKSKKIVFGFVYNCLGDRFNLSHALQFFFETESIGILESRLKNLAFGKVENSYFMFDCQTKGSPVFNTDNAPFATYALKCETLNMLVYCMTLTLNATRHNELFHLYSVDIKLNEKSK